MVLLVQKIRHAIDVEATVLDEFHFEKVKGVNASKKAFVVRADAFDATQRSGGVVDGIDVANVESLFGLCARRRQGLRRRPSQNVGWVWWCQSE